MFKGLRTKIESEQKGQGSIKTLQAQPKSLNKTNESYHSDSTANRGTISTQINEHRPASHIGPSNQAASLEVGHDLGGAENDNVPKASDITLEAQSILINNNQAVTTHQHHNNNLEHVRHDRSGAQTVETLRADVLKHQEQLESVIKERDASNDHNAQLYQLIEKLRRSLETEKETRSSLEAKLQEAEKSIAEASQTKQGKHASSKSFDPSMMMKDSVGELLQSEDVEELRRHLIDCQSQIIDKNRQLKIRQQNLIDIKRHLQREIADHAKTQDELARIQNQLKQANQISSASSESATPQNGLSSCDTESNKSGPVPSNNFIGTTMDTRQSSVHGDGIQDTTRMTESIARLQYDNISCISRSSVDDNDLHDNLHHSSSNREINNEYLKNVLFRYMTSTDTDTAKHLVKALSVMMNFTPEQTAAIKNAMNARSSWLRLK